MQVQRECEVCGNKFSVPASKIKDGRGRFCSKDCFYLHKRKRVGCICKICGREFNVPQSSADRGEGKYCSQKCYGKSISLNRVGTQHPSWKRTKKICKICGREFNVPQSELNRGNGIYCSKKCQSMSYSERYKKEGNPAWKNASLYTSCLVCGKSFRRHNDGTKGVGRYCSNTCKGIWMSQNRSGINHPNYIHGESGKPYPLEWSADLRRRIRHFFGNKCLLCGKPRADLNEELICHHVNYDKKAPKDGEPLKDYLYVTLCRSCHGRMIKHSTKDYWKQCFTNLIITRYSGKCFYESQEYLELINGSAEKVLL